MFGQKSRELRELITEVADMKWKLETVLNELRQKPKVSDLAELEGRCWAYIDAFSFGREHIFERLPDKHWRGNPLDLLELIRCLVDTGVCRWGECEQYRREIDKLKAEIAKGT